MRKFFKILITTVLLLILAFIVYFVVSIFDNTDNTDPAIREKGYSAGEVFSNEMTKDLDTEEDINIIFDEYALNQLFYGAIKDINISGVKFRGAHLFYDKADNLNLELPISIYGVSSCFKCCINISEENGTFTFNLKNISVGKITASSNFLYNVLKNNIKEEDLEKSLQEKGLYCDIDLQTMLIKITKENLIDSISTILKDDENCSLFVLLADLFIGNSEIVDFVTTGNHIGFILHSTNLQYDATRDGDLGYSLNLNSVKSTIESRLENEVNYSNVSAVFNYHSIGYKNLNDEQKEIINALGYDKNNTGVKPENDTTMEKHILSQQPTFPIFDGKFDVVINETVFNDIFSSLKFIGSGLGFCDANQISYLCVESLYINIIDNAFTISLIVKINNQRLILNIDVDAQPSNSYSIVGTISKIRFGSVTLNESFTTSFYKYLDSALKDLNWINVDENYSSITIDLESILVSNSAFKQIADKCGSKTLSFKSKSDGVGELILSYSLI